MKKALTKRQVASALKKLPDWTLNKAGTQIARTFSFETHVDALVFIARITVHAEVLKHHPEVVFTHQKVKIKLMTHDADNQLTQLDIDVAKRIDAAYGG